MPKYYVHTKKDAQGDYEVHKEGCDYLPSAANREYLGTFSGCKEAVKAAEDKGYKPANGCVHCSKECHTS